MRPTRLRFDLSTRLAALLTGAVLFIVVSAHSQDQAAAPANPVQARIVAYQNSILTGDPAVKALPKATPTPDALKHRAFLQAVRIVANTRIPPNFRELSRSRAPRAARAVATKATPSADPTATSFDWRTQGKVTPVRTYMGNTGQDGCGSCWCFTAVSTAEDSLLIRSGGDPKDVDASEQFILDSGKTGGCDGDWYWTAWTLMESPGTCTEAAVPYKGYVDLAEGKANAGVAKPYQVEDFHLVDDNQDIPSVADIKKALCQYGPLAVAIMADEAFMSYPQGGDVFKGFASGTTVVGGPINHAVTLIGWDDSKNAWLIKNSWGTDWGTTGGSGTDRGYIWVDYNSNNVGYAAAWVISKSAR